MHDANQHRPNGCAHQYLAVNTHSSSHFRQRFVHFFHGHYNRPYDNADCRPSGAFKSHGNRFDPRSNRLHRRKRGFGHGNKHGEHHPRRRYVRSVGQRNFARGCGNRQYGFAERYLRERLHVQYHVLRNRNFERTSTRQPSRTLIRLLQDSALHGIQSGRMPRRIRLASVSELSNKSVCKKQTASEKKHG